MLAGDKSRAKSRKSLQRHHRAGLVTPFDEMERMFEEFGKRGWLHPFQREWPRKTDTQAPFEGQTPTVDLIDHEKEVIVRAELPGVDKEDLEVTLTEHSVTIRACASRKEIDEEGEYNHHGIAHGDFLRTLDRPEGIDESKARAKFRNGVLTLTMPKTKPARREKIPVE